MGILSDIAELVWPSRCAVCDLPGVHLCATCAASFAFIDQGLCCPYCGMADGALQCTCCHAPSRVGKRFSFASARSAVRYDEGAARLVKAYKEEGGRALAPIIAELMCTHIPLPHFEQTDALCFVPADENALRKRDFDHMELVTCALGERLGMQVLPLLRKRDHGDQRLLDRSGRLANSEGAFAIRSRFIGELPPRIMLVDDVLTTGATVDAASAVLSGAGIGEVHVATFARVP